MIAIDIDYFKAINDTHGHAVGDQALCHVARFLEMECRNVDTLSRVGGEEFMALLVNMPDQSSRNRLVGFDGRFDAHHQRN